MIRPIMNLTVNFLIYPDIIMVGGAQFGGHIIAQVRVRRVYVSVLREGHSSVRPHKVSPCSETCFSTQIFIRRLLIQGVKLASATAANGNSNTTRQSP